MELTELIAGMCEHLRIEPLEPDARGAYEVVFDDGLDVEILPLSGAQFLVRSQIGELTEDESQREDLLRSRLQQNLQNLPGQFCSLTLDREDRVIWLFQMARTSDLDVRGLGEMINAFVNTLEWWRNMDTPEGPSSPASFMPPINMIRP